MKTILLHLFNFLFISTAFAQNVPFEATIRNSFFSYGEYILPMDDGENIIVGKNYISGLWGDEILRLDKVDASGNLLWSNTYPALIGEAYHFHGATQSTDNNFYIAGNQGGCDYFGYDDIMKFDAEGNLLWSKTESDLAGSFSGPLITSSNGGVWLNGYTELRELDDNGNFLQVVQVNSSYIDKFDYNLSNGDIAVFGGPTSNKKLIYVENSGNEYDLAINETQAHLKFLDNDMLVLLTDDRLRLYDNQLNLINSLNVSGLSASFNYTELTCDSQYIYTISWDGPDSSRLMKVDYNLGMMDEFTAPFCRDIDVKDNYVKIIGDEYKHTWVKNVNNDFGEAYANTDIGVVNVLVNTADSTYFGGYYDCNTHFEAEGIRVVVKNFGTETINYFEVNALYDYCFGICYEPQDMMMIYDNRNLLPGQLDTVDFPDVNLYWISNYSRLCLYTTRPNKLTDKDYDNDEICRDFFVNDIVDINEVENIPNIEVFPNPTTGIFNVRGIPEGEYHVFNTTGQIIQVGQLEYNTAIDISALSQGVYFVSIMVNDEQVVKRLVKI